MELPHSFTSRTCRCRPGRLANTWPPAREPPACQDSLKVCVSNPAGPAGQDRRWLGRLQAGPCAAWSKDWGPLPNSESARTSRRASIVWGCYRSFVRSWKGSGLLGISGTQVRWGQLSIWVVPGQPHSREDSVREQSEPGTLALRCECGSLVMSLRGPVPRE